MKKYFPLIAVVSAIAAFAVLIFDGGRTTYEPYEGEPPTGRKTEQKPVPPRAAVAEERRYLGSLPPSAVSDWHSVSTDEYGQRYGQLGAMKYVLVGNSPVSYGFHSFRRLSNGRWVGTTGAMTCLLSTRGMCASDGFHSIRPRSDGKYDAELGAQRFVLDSNGEIE